MRTREFPSADRQENHGYKIAVGAIQWQPDAGSKGVSGRRESRHQFGISAHQQTARTHALKACLSFAEKTAKRRIACGLLLGHIVSHALYGNLEGAGLAADQTPGEGDR